MFSLKFQLQKSHIQTLYIFAEIYTYNHTTLLNDDTIDDIVNW